MLPGGILWIFAVLLAVRGADALMAPLLRWWPALLIVASLVIAFWPRGASQSKRLEVHHAPPRRQRNNASTKQSLPSTIPQDSMKQTPGSTIEVLPDPDE
jgi:hypothetical protein